MRYELALNEIVVELDRQLSTPDPPTHPLPVGEPRNPFKGLRAFNSNDAQDFFGRDTLIQELVDILKGMLLAEKPGKPGSRLLSAIGPSGSGKSSVMMAGLLPHLQRGDIAGSEQWVYLEPMAPGPHPLEALVLTLSPYFPNRSLKSIRQDLEGDSARGLQLLATLLVKEPGQKVVLLIDQFEELFNLTTSEKERQQFIDLLVTAATEPGGPLLLLLTLRADFYDRPFPYRELSWLIQRYQSVVLPMEMRDLRAAIRQPAALPDVQLTFEGNLVGDLLFEVQGQPGALPLLQFTLDQLFERRQNRLLTVQAYQEIGGVKGALAKQAEATYAALPSEEHRRLARSLFLRLIDPGLTELDTTRRRATLTELSLSTPQETELLQQVTGHFLAARLLTTSEIAGIPTIEVSHEALIREWARLDDWLWEARDDIRLQQTISKDVAEWERRGKPKDRLYRGSQLKEAKNWARNNTPSKDESMFLRASGARTMRYRISAIGIVLLVLLLSIPTYLLFQPYFTANVTNLNDNGPGSLLQAVATASAGSTITFDSSLRGQIVLTSGDLVISKNLTIRGPGAHILSIVGGKHLTHKLSVLAGVTVTISGLSFSSLNDSGVKNYGDLTFMDSIISNNTTPGNGAGIENFEGGTLTLIRSEVLGNSVDSDYTDWAKNKDFGNGGGIANHSILKIINSTISNNRASGDGGGILNGYHSPGAVTIINSTISGNEACRGGGGIFNHKGSLSLTNTTVSGNKVGNCNSFTYDPIGVGGGVKNFGSLTLTNDTISNNTAPKNGGGIYNGINNTDFGYLTLSNSTIWRNTASVDGGGIDNDGGQATLTFGTIYGNTAQIGGGIAIENNVHNTFSLLVAMSNSIVAGNHADSAADISGNLTSKGYNLVQDTSGAIFAPNDHPPDISGVQFTNLGIDSELRNNGGPTWTLRLLKGSPAIDKIPPDTCLVNKPTTDQRGVIRPKGPACDIGAYEYVPSP
jgi:hypothetical protein